MKGTVFVGRTYMSDIHASLLFRRRNSGRIYAAPTIPSTRQYTRAGIADLFNNPLQKGLLKKSRVPPLETANTSFLTLSSRRRRRIEG